MSAPHPQESCVIPGLTGKKKLGYVGLKRYSLVRALLVIMALVLVAILVPVSAMTIAIDNSSTTAIASNISYIEAHSTDISNTLLLKQGTYFENDITISKNITIEANTTYGDTAANTIIDGQASGSSIFTVDSGYSLAIDNLTLQNGVNNFDYGGAIANNGGTISITSSTFTDCSATGFSGGGGGAIANNGGTISIFYSTFTGCTSSNRGGSYGGAIFNGAGTISITSSTFTDCSSTSLFSGGYGGAIYNGDTISISSSTFTACSATGGAGGGGAAICNGGTISSIASSTFTDCTANSCVGGAIYNSGLISSITTSTFSGCTTTAAGGAIYNGAGTINSITTSTVTDCSATGGDGGGVIWNYGTISSIASSTFTDCSATGGGDGGVIWNTGTITMNFSRIYNDNTGTAIYANAGITTVTDNWWGTNSGSGGEVTGPGIDYSPWLVLGITASPSSLSTGGTSAVQAHLTRDSTGLDTSSGGVFVPNGIPVMFTVVGGPGSVTPPTGTTTSGACPAIFSSGTTGTATVNATVDEQSVSAVITISAAHGGGHSTGTYYWVNTGNTEEQGYTGPEPTVMGYNPPPVTPAGTPVVAPQSRQVAGSTPVIEQQTVAAPPAASTAPSSGIPVVPAVAALAGIGVIGGGGLLARRWWIQRQNPALFRKYD